MNRGINAQSGFIAREKELNEAQNEVDCCTNLIARVEEKLRIGKEKLKQLEQRCDELQSTLLIDQKDYADIVSQKNLRQVQIVHMEKRYQYLDTESTEIKQRQERCQQDLKEALNLLQEAMQIKEQHECLKETLLSQRNQLYIALDEEKVKNEKMKSLKNQLNLNLESAKTKSETLHTAVDRIKQQMVVLLERQKQLSKSLEKEQCPVQQFESELEKVLQQRIESEEALKVAKQRASGFEEEMQTLVQKQRCSMDRIQKLQQILEEKKLHMQELKVRQTTLQEQLTEIRFDIEELLEQMSREETSEAECSAKIEKIKIQLEKLGAINLAAIQEYETLNERQGYLSKQKSDLEEALTTLQNAICKIDGETRNRFKETFEKLNHHFQILFPKIFGGGQAYLELTSQNLLESGVILMAKPPGKCIKSTSLMSGGEKALTAIALVFSLFQLNPAPFCLLDEVDAPLDEVNIGHFCNLLKEMAEKIQLIFISHNKNTIEVAEYLTGITMKEPGVSNVLAVDIDQALMMAEA